MRYTERWTWVKKPVIKLSGYCGSTKDGLLYRPSGFMSWEMEGYRKRIHDIDTVEKASVAIRDYWHEVAKEWDNGNGLLHRGGGRSSMTHYQFMKKHKPSKVCSASDMNFGGSCFNCGYHKSTATFTRHIPTKERPTQKWVLTDNETGEILAYSHRQISAIRYAEELGYIILNKDKEVL